jgi:anti-anti-sigma factor
MHVPLQKLIVDEVDGVCVIRVRSPNIFDDQIDSLRREFASVVAEARPRAVVLDFSNVSMISSLGVGTVIGLYKKVRENGGRLALCSLNPVVEHVFQLCQIIESDDGKGLLAVYPDAPSAAAALAAAA